MKHLFANVEPLSVARALGYPAYPEFRVDDLSTYGRLRGDAEAYKAQLPAINGYPCWIPEAGLVRINPDMMPAA